MSNNNTDPRMNTKIMIMKSTSSRDEKNPMNTQMMIMASSTSRDDAADTNDKITPSNSYDSELLHLEKIAKSNSKLFIIL